jgi:Protein of unknown function (DUF1580)
MQPIAILCEAHVIDVFSETILSMSDAARRMPRLRNRRPVHVSTIWRWAFRGVKGICLETTMLGGVRVTSLEALRRFFAAINKKGPDRVNATTTRASVESELDELGL